MKKIHINGKEYKLKFGYMSVAGSGIMGDVLEATQFLSGMEEDDDTAVFKAISKIMPLVGRIVLAGMQRYHSDEFGVDYEDEADVKAKLSKVYAMLDDYFDPEEGQTEESAIELFWDFANELSASGFLSGNPQTAAERIAAIPQDHLKPQN